MSDLAGAEKRYLTTAEVAALCRAPEETVRWWRHVGKGPRSFRLGRRVLYPADAVEQWLQTAESSGAETR